MDPNPKSRRLSNAKVSEFLLTQERLVYKVQVAGEDMAKATKPSYLHTQHGHRPECWYYVKVDDHINVDLVLKPGL
ncbi:hypothetical protein PtB15_10B61 [Puccinia triticina]|nr:hypothetical protein PtB15_10B61 [Puccinia triticina]